MAPTCEELEAEHCWEAGDDEPGHPETTAFRRAARLHHSRWREDRDLPVGTHPFAPRKGELTRPVGSRLPLMFAKESGANFLDAAALDAARAWTSFIEPHQSFDHQRLWADLLSSAALAFNLFGGLSADLRRAAEAAHAWWPDAPGTVSDVRFAHSPGRLDPADLKSLRAFDTAFVLDRDDGTHAIVGVDVHYHELIKPETPKPENAWRYTEVAEQSGAFKRGTIDELIRRSELCLVWLKHLLLLSMLQHTSGAWSWGRSVFVYPAGHTHAAELCDRYHGMLADDSTFTSTTLEELLDARALPPKTTAALRRRYLIG